MRIIVCGGRAYADAEAVRRTLDALEPAAVCEGGAAGADTLARRWALDRGVPLTTYAADWAAHGRAAGPLRNAQMLTEFRPDAVLAFPGGAGTADMVRRARAAGVRVIEGPIDTDS